MIIFSPVAYPIAKLLDVVLGEHSDSFYRRDALKALVEIHARSPENFEQGLSPNEVKLVRGALDLKTKRVEEVMRPINTVFMLEEKSKVIIIIFIIINMCVKIIMINYIYCL